MQEERIRETREWRTDLKSKANDLDELSETVDVNSVEAQGQGKWVREDEFAYELGTSTEMLRTWIQMVQRMMDISVS